MYSHRNSEIINLFPKLFQHSKSLKPLNGDKYKISIYNEIQIMSNLVNKNNSTQIKKDKIEEVKKEEENKDEIKIVEEKKNELAEVTDEEIIDDKKNEKIEEKKNELIEVTDEEIIDDKKNEKIEEKKNELAEDNNEEIIEEKKEEIKIEEEKKEEEESKIIEKKYKLPSYPNSIIKIPPNYSTDDEDEYKLVSILNSPLDKNWKLALNDEKNNIKVYKKELTTTNALLLKTYSSLPYSLKTIMEVLDDYNFRMKWDKTFKIITLVEKIPKKENESFSSYINYSYMNFPFPMTDRDFVQKHKTWYNYLGNEKCVLNHNKSTTHEKYPEKNKPIRAEMIIGGFYFEEIKDNLTNIYLINNADVKATTGISIINSKAPESPKNFIMCLRNGCDMWIKGKKK